MVIACCDPYQRGPGLTANPSALWRDRVGDWRVLCESQDDRLLVLVVSINHRSEACRRG